MRLLFLFFTILTALATQAQESRSWQSYRAKARLWIHKSDSLLPMASGEQALPGSFVLRNAEGTELPDSLFRIEGRLFRPSPQLQALKQDSFWLEYRRMSSLSVLGKMSSNKDSLLAMGLPLESLAGKRYQYNPSAQQGQQNPAFDTEGLNYTGSFSRGVALGNRQDLLLNSQFNLQLGGKIGEVEVQGAISDNNVPLQPEGNTRQLQDFDRLFLQAKLRGQSLMAGDYDLKSSDASYFSNYRRRLQGIQIETGFRLGEQGRIKNRSSGAFSRGKFARNTIQGQEGNQGPYRLRGANNEQFIIILAGTERVFIDGQLIERGSDADYVIDYNLGEILFTNKQLITRDKRILVEFSYSDLNYLRSLVTHGIDYENPEKGLALSFQYYSERDMRNQPIDGPLPDSLQLLLAEAGDSPSGTLRSGVQPLDAAASAEQDTRISLYQYRDTIVGSIGYDSILVFVPNAEGQVYRVRFSLLGEGRGNYRRRIDNSNGSVFDWVAPDPQTGQPRGNYAPVVQLVAPQSQQLYALDLRKKLFGDKAELQGHLALSHFDKNTFSQLDAEDDYGLGSRIAYKQDIALSGAKDSSKQRQWTAELGGHYEYVQASFRQIEPYRAREFQRDWAQSEADSAAQVAEHWLGLDLGLRERNLGSLHYSLQYLQRGRGFAGWRQLAHSQWNYKGLTFVGSGSLVSNSGSDAVSNLFFTPKADLSYSFEKLGKLRIGAYYEAERRESRRPSDSLDLRSFEFQIYKAYAELPLSKGFSLQAHLLQRRDILPQALDFVQASVANEARLGGEWNMERAGRLSWNINYRSLAVQDTTLIKEQDKETYLGRVEYNGQYKRGLLKWNSIYELGAGQQQKMEFNYVQVDRGLGTHQWIDRNDNGLQEQTEFEISPFPDQADFIRVAVLTGEFVRSDNVQFQQSVDIRPQVFFARRGKRDSSAWRHWHWLGKLQGRSQWRIDRKTLAGADVLPFNPFQVSIADTSLVSLQSQWRNNMYINRSDPAWGGELQHQRLAVQNTLVNGSEYREQEDLTLQARRSIKRRFQLEGEYQWSRSDYNSVVFAERNYALLQQSWKPSMAWQWESLWRIQASYKGRIQRNSIGEEEELRSHELSLESTYSKSAALTMRLKLSLVELAYTGSVNTPVQFIMLQGLQEGRNYLWSLSMERAIGKNLQVSISYEGRKTGDLSPIHVGRAQVRALF